MLKWDFLFFFFSPGNAGEDDEPQRSEASCVKEVVVLSIDCLPGHYHDRISPPQRWLTCHGTSAGLESQAFATGSLHTRPMSCFDVRPYTYLQAGRPKRQYTFHATDATSSCLVRAGVLRCQVMQDRGTVQMNHQLPTITEGRHGEPCTEVQYRISGSALCRGNGAVVGEVPVVHE
nr:hypothetical protein CFP56_11888 [Quercus suber]